MSIVVAQSSPPHYAFQEEDRILIGTDFAHLAVELDFQDIVNGISQIPLVYHEILQSSLKCNTSAKANLQAIAELVQREYSTIVIDIRNIVGFVSGASVYIPPLKPLQKGTSADQAVMIGNALVKRQKRFVGALIGAIAGFVGSQALFGFLDSGKLEYLHQNIDNLYERDRHMILLMSKENKDILANRNILTKVAKLTSTLSEMVDGNFEVTKMIIAEKYVMQMLSEVRRGLHVISRTLEGSTQQKLAFGTFTYKGATKYLAKIRTMARKRGLVPLIQSAQQLMQLPCSFAPRNNSLILYVHVPLARESSVLTLYRYHSFPIKITENVVAMYHNPKNLLALSNDPVQGNFFLELELSDLQGCKSINNVRVCPQLQFLSKSTQPSCLIDLYFSDHESAIKTCKLHLYPPKDTVIPLGNNVFLAYTLNPSTYSVSCPINNTHQSGYQLSHTQRIEVPTHCVVQLPNFNLYSQSILNVSVPPKTYQWTLLPKTMFPALTPKYLEEALDILKTIEHLPPTDFTDIQTSFLVNHPWSPHKWPLYLTSSGVLFFLVILAILLLAYRLAYKRLNPATPLEDRRDDVNVNNNA